MTNANKNKPAKPKTDDEFRDGPPDLILEEPQMMEIDRSEFGPPRPELESLSTKLKAHYNKGPPKKRKDPLKSVLTPEFINRVAVPIYLFTVFSSVKIGFFDVMPQVYEGNDWAIFLHKAFVAIIFVQMMSNWWGIRSVDSGYRRYKLLHGDPLQSLLAKGNPALSDNSSSPDPQDPQDNTIISAPPEEEIEKTNSDLLTEAHQANKVVAERQLQQTSIADLLKSNQDVQNSKLALDTCSQLSHSSSESPTTVKASGGRKSSSKQSQQKSAKRSSNAQTEATSSENDATVYKFPYWSWVPCFTCRWTRPPRCHHCPVCKTCVLKRDHHCFFAGACVGYRNYRFFCVFLVWSWIGAMYATLHGFPYVYMFLWEEYMAYVDVLFPVAIIRYVFGYVPFQVALSVTTLTLLVYFDFLTGTFVYAHFRLVSWGLTSFEKARLNPRTLQLKDTRSIEQKFRAVFGKNWGYSFIIPASFRSDPEEDPINWPHMTVIKLNKASPQDASTTGKPQKSSNDKQGKSSRGKKTGS